MGKPFSEIFQSYVNKSYGELLDKGKSKLSIFEAEAEKYFEGSQVNVSLFILTFISQAIAADGKFTFLEQKFISDLLSTEPENLLSLLKSEAVTSEENIELSNKAISSFSKEGRSAACILALIVAAVDETITREESDFLKNLAK